MNPFVKWGCLYPTVAVVALILGVFYWDRFVPSGPRRALPRSATEVQEYYRDHWNGDFVRVIKARLPEADVPRYAKALGLTERFDPVAHREISSRINSLRNVAGQPWFTPPQADATTYLDHKRGDDYFQVLWYGDGFVYFIALSS
jgi:hypothetical protein